LATPYGSAKGHQQGKGQEEDMAKPKFSRKGRKYAKEMSRSGWFWHDLFFTRIDIFEIAWHSSYSA